MKDTLTTSYKSYVALLLLFLITAVCTFGRADAQGTASPIRWRMTVKMTSASEGIITVRALIDKGWHLYGTELPDGGPRPTSFDFSGSEGIVLTGKPVPSVKAAEKEDKQFGTRLSQWESNVNFTQRFRLAGKGNAATVKLTVKYMGCNDVTCLPPRTETFSTPVPPFKQKK